MNRPLAGIACALLGVLGTSFACPEGDPRPKGMHGTAMKWEASVEEAAKKAKEEGKLILVLHLAGHFDDPHLT